MKKLFKLTLQKVNFRLIFFLSMVLLLTNSCRKDSQDLPLTKSELIAEARSYFENEIINLPQLRDNNARDALGKIPLWDKAKVKKISLGDAVIVPIKYNTDIYTKQNGKLTSLEKLSYLMVYKDHKQNIHTEWVTLMPNDTGEKTQKFIGTVEIKDWNGKFRRAFAFGADGTVLPVYPTETSIFRKASYARSTTCYTHIWYGQNCVVGYGCGNFYLISSETFCFSDSGEGQEGQGSGSSNNQNTEEEAVVDDYITSYYMDCNEDIDGTAYWNSNCNTCMGGNTGITECPKDIKIDTSARKCLDTLSKGIISSASILSAFQKIFTIETNSNSVSGMINRISQSSDWNVVIREGNIGSETNYAGDTIETNATTSATQGKVYITFNKSYLNNATNLSIARTMIHELMHSYFTYGLAMSMDPGYGKFIEANDLLFKKNGNPYYDQNDAQHQQIANKYVTQMSSLLEAYAISAGIQSPDPSMSLADYCKDLAWGGLKDTKAYRKYATDKSRIDNHLKSEAKNDSNSTKKKGC
ncbi:hypothetical protein ACHMWN_03050 [Pedobacter sp. UC225_61]|uniref:hypothetical protein n=1 Tax=Pedobacter sp. UC225_61 TaxID=3374623 RepID=UPI0037A721E1